jgi:hypothetical protein
MMTIPSPSSGNGQKQGESEKINWLILLVFQESVFAKNGSKPKLAKVLDD